MDAGTAKKVIEKNLSYDEVKRLAFREAAANLLTIDEVDPFGKIPEFKFCAVQVEALGAAHAETTAIAGVRA